MKRKLAVLGLLGFAALFGCSQVDNTVSAGKEGEFEVVSKESFDYNYFTKIKHKETGCYYLYVTSSQKAGLTQMFIEKDGASVPYCEE